jgi:hypothetical protein
VYPLLKENLVGWANRPTPAITRSSRIMGMTSFSRWAY